jgi:hypothetical protein
VQAVAKLADLVAEAVTLERRVGQLALDLGLLVRACGQRRLSRLSRDLQAARDPLAAVAADQDAPTI